MCDLETLPEFVGIEVRAYQKRVNSAIRAEKSPEHLHGFSTELGQERVAILSAMYVIRLKKNNQEHFGGMLPHIRT